jgi:hypothetical protein
VVERLGPVVVGRRELDVQMLPPLGGHRFPRAAEEAAERAALGIR